MSDHAKVTEEDIKLAKSVVFASMSSYAKAAQLLADAIRDARLKEAELIRQNFSRSYNWLNERIEQLKRGEA